MEQTEALARAFLAAIEARQAIRPLDHPGFEGRAIAAACQDIELISATLEGALRTRRDTSEWTDELRHELTVVAWFASLAMPDEQPAVAAAGRTVHALLATIEALLAVGAEETELAGPQPVARAA